MRALAGCFSGAHDAEPFVETRSQENLARNEKRVCLGPPVDTPARTRTQHTNHQTSKQDKEDCRHDNEEELPPASKKHAVVPFVQDRNNRKGRNKMKEEAQHQNQNASNSTAALSLAAFYESNGFVGPIQVLSRNEAQHAYREYQEWVEHLPDQQVTGDLRFKPHLFLPFVNRIVRHSKLVEAVQQVLKSTHVLLWSCDFNVKQPDTEMCFPPHQDATYAGLLPADQCVTAWVALSDPVGEEEGCLCFWEASHKKGQLPHAEQPTDVHNMLSRGQHMADTLKEKDCVAVPLRGGEATLHNFYTVHRSGRNRSTIPRVGLAIRYMAASVVQTGKVRETVTLISGSPQHDGFDLEPNLPLQNPTEVDIRIGKDAHAEAMRREAANYFDGADMSAYDESINKD